MFDFSNPENPILEVIRKISNLIILNIAFLLGCIPIITIGASISALYTVCFRVVRQEDPYIWKGFWQAFRANFRQSTLLWLICLPVIVVLAGDFLFLQTQSSSFASYLQMGVWAVTFVALGTFHYLFPCAAHFVCTLSQCLKNALLMCFGHLPYTLLFLLLDGIVVFLALHSVNTLGMVFMLCLICGFSCTALFKAILFHRIFRVYETTPASEETEA